MMNNEFKMYEQHFRRHTSKSNMEFMWNMFYSLTQQLVRQDSAWYALKARSGLSPTVSQSTSSTYTVDGKRC